MAKGDDIREKLVEFAVSVMGLCDRLPKTTAGLHIADQLLRSGTSAAPNYAEARGAERTRDFVHKLEIVLKELNEAEVWIDILVRQKMAEDQPVLRIQEECKVLRRIIAASVRTAKWNLGRAKEPETQEPGFSSGSLRRCSFNPQSCSSGDRILSTPTIGELAVEVEFSRFWLKR